MMLGYVDPGSGFVFGQGFALLWAVLLGFVGTLMVGFKFFFNFFKKLWWLILIIIMMLSIAGGIHMLQPGKTQKVIVLGIDGMDPGITERLMKEGRLPHCALLAKNGSYAHLASTVPTETIVVWSSFATGLPPGEHGIFDFVMRTPDYSPYLSLNEIYNAHGQVKVKIRRKGQTFWEILSSKKIPSFIYFCPNTFPSQRFLGKMLSGMGVPDLSGTMGKYSFYSSKPDLQGDRDSRGRLIPIALANNSVATEIYGPKVQMRKSVSESTVPLTMRVEPEKSSVSFECQGSRFVLGERSWSGWQRITFKIGMFKKAHGIVRFYLKSIAPYLEVYMSPVNFDPTKPLFPISFPRGLSKHIAEKNGFYYTQGMPFDTWALTEGRLDEEAFLQLVDGILAENEAMLESELKTFNQGVFFYYIEALDIIQHMFWRYNDARHPLFEDNGKFKDVITRYYERIDALIGRVLKSLDQNTTFMVLSDHGFSSFRKAVHVNRWLLEKGYLFLKNDAQEGKEFFENVDWPRTKAYALGFGGVYINKKGREREGIVNDSELPDIKHAIAQGLKQFNAPVTGEPVVNQVYFQENVFKGKYADKAPDLFIGFNPGFRASWNTALGGVPTLLIEDNRKKWSGDHLIDPVFVPGVLFINKKTSLKEPDILDIAPTLLTLFNSAIPNELKGRALLKNDGK